MATNNAASEAAPLLGASSSSCGQSPHEDNNSLSSESGTATQRLWEELDRPWPSTFERSIGLLASPVIPRAQVDLFTKSPKPGSTPMALARRNNLDRGFYTPDPAAAASIMSRNRMQDVHLTDSERGQGGGFYQGLAKVQSLDFASKSKVRFDAESKHAKKIEEAKQYRAQILAKQEKTQKKSREQSTKQQQRGDVGRAPVVEEKSSVLQSAFNLANILMGVGLLGLPFAFKAAGILGGTICVFGFGYMAWRTTLLIGQELNGDPRRSDFFDDSPFKSPLPPGSTSAARMLPPISSFPEIARNSFGEIGCLLLSFVLYFELFSCICIFFVTMADHLHQLFPQVATRTLMVIVASISVIPAILLRTPTLLSYLSMVGTFSTVSVVMSVLVTGIVEGDLTQELAAKLNKQGEGPFHHLWDASGIAMALGIVAYCFSGHAIIPSIYSSMKEPQKFDRMATITFLAVLLCCEAVGVAGYHMFGDLVADQVTLSMEEVVKAPLIMKGLVWLMVLTAFSKTTLTMFPLALGMEEIVAPYLTSDLAISMASGTIKIVLTGLALLVAIFAPSFSYICALVGMICTMSVSIILPAGAHLKLFGSRLSLFEKLLDWIFVLLGIFLAIAGTIATL